MTTFNTVIRKMISHIYEYVYTEEELLKECRVLIENYDFSSFGMGFILNDLHISGFFIVSKIATDGRTHFTRV